MMKWFGLKPWSPMCQDCPRVEIPVGEPCLHCGEPIEAGGDGVMIPHGDTGDRPWHWECNLRGIIGGLNHLNGACSCCGGTDDPDPPEMTKRQAAQAAVDYYTHQQMLKYLEMFGYDRAH